MIVTLVFELIEYKVLCIFHTLTCYFPFPCSIICTTTPLLFVIFNRCRMYLVMWIVILVNLPKQHLQYVATFRRHNPIPPINFLVQNIFWTTEKGNLRDRAIKCSPDRNFDAKLLPRSAIIWYYVPIPLALTNHVYFFK